MKMAPGCMTPAQFECCVMDKKRAGDLVDAAFEVLVKGYEINHVSKTTGMNVNALRTRCKTLFARHLEFMAAYGGGNAPSNS